MSDIIALEGMVSLDSLAAWILHETDTPILPPVPTPENPPHYKQLGKTLHDLPPSYKALIRELGKR